MKYICVLLALMSSCASKETGDIKAADLNRRLKNTVIHPDSFEASIGGFLGESYRVELQSEGTLVYLHNSQTFTSGPGTEKSQIKVTGEQWREFRKALDAASVWNWKEEYTDHGVHDGTQWHLRIKYSDASIYSHGSNNSPSKRQYERYLKAVVTLLGGRKFQ
ncbi:MAG: hypothetical protein QM496_04765 [Verrucomicrobiota bacterium]